MVEKERILSEIRRLAEANDGKPLGRGRFSEATGIRETDWLGRYWARWSDAVQRNGVRTRIFYGAIEKANELLAAEDRPPVRSIAFHSLRRTYAALRAELGEHPAITAAQMGHRDPRMTLRVYTDVTGMRPRTRLGGLLGDADWTEAGRKCAI